MLHAAFLQPAQQAVWRCKCKVAKASLVLRRVRRIRQANAQAALHFLTIVNNKGIDAEAVAWTLGPRVEGVSDVATAIRDEVGPCLCYFPLYFLRRS